MPLKSPKLKKLALYFLLAPLLFSNTSAGTGCRSKKDPVPRIVYEGVATKNVEIENVNPLERTIYDFENYDFNGFNLQIVNCSNLVIYKPSVILKYTDVNCIKIDHSEDIVLYQPSTQRGSNGIKLTNLTTNCLVYEGESELARNDGFSCHKAAEPCGDNNIFYGCKGSGGEQGFDITSGEGHLIMNSSGGGLNKISLAIGHGASCNVINFSSPGQIITIKETPGVNLCDLQVKGVTLKRQGSNNGSPSNVQLYGRSAGVKNATGLNLSSIYSYKFSEFTNPLKESLNEKLDWINKNLD